jgi:phage terminase large subunit
MLKTTTALRKISAMRSRIKVIRGGQGAGKTMSVLTLIINHAAGVPNRNIIIASEELTKMRMTVIRDFIKVMTDAGIYNPSNFIAGTLYRYPNGSTVKFIGLDKEDIGKGLRCDLVYFNEVNKISFSTYQALASRAGQVIADYNPDAHFFIDDEVIPRDDCDFLQLTFADNEELPKTERDEILRYFDDGYDDEGEIKNKYWANMWQVYGLGNIGALFGVVFENWEIIDKVPEGARLEGTGIDFGYTNDPTVVIDGYTFDGARIYDEIIHEPGLLNADIFDKIEAAGRLVGPKYADSAEPKSIAELRKLGLNIIGADKGPDSVRFGISEIQKKKFFVTKRSLSLIANLRAYRWATDKNGKAMNTPIDKDNHGPDAMRYLEVGRGKYSGNYVVR